MSRRTRDSLSNLSARLLVYPLNIAATVVTARILGSADRGSYVFALMFSSAILPICFFGTGTAILYLHSSERFDVKESAWPSLSLGLGAGLITTALIAVLYLQGWLGETGNGLQPEVVWAALASLPFEGAFLAGAYVLQGRGRFVLSNRIKVAKTALQALGVIVICSLGQRPLLGSVLFVALTQVLSGTGFFFFFAKDYGLGPWLHAAYWREALSYGLKAWLGNISHRANNQLDQLLLSIFTESSALGIYSVAHSFVNLLRIPPQAVAPVVFHAVARETDARKAHRLLAQVHRGLFSAMGLVAAAAIVVSFWLMPLIFGPQYAGSYIPFVVLVPGVVAHTVTRALVQKYLGAQGMPLKTSQIQAVGALVTGLAALGLLPIMGVLGAAIASSLGYLASAAFALRLYAAQDTGPLRDLFAIGPRDLAWMNSRIRSIGP